MRFLLAENKQILFVEDYVKGLFTFIYICCFYLVAFGLWLFFFFFLMKFGRACGCGNCEIGTRKIFPFLA